MSSPTPTGAANPAAEPPVLRHPEVSYRWQARLRQVGRLLVAHRGTHGASIAQNSLPAARVALASGADAVELDATRSADGQWFCFHDGLEAELLDVEENLTELDAAAVDAASYRWLWRPGRTLRVPRLDDVLLGLRSDAGDAPLVNLDRSWPWWSTFLDHLDELAMAPQLLLKCPAADERALALLAEHPTNYPFMPICRSVDEVEAVLATPGLATIGVELIADSAAHAFCDPAWVASLHARGVFSFVNAETLPMCDDLFCGWDDETSLLEGSDAGWDELFRRGYTAVQTDWPWLARQARDAWAAGQPS